MLINIKGEVRAASPFTLLGEIGMEELNISQLQKKAGSLPMSPGVYIMRDRSGKVIYVGKSKKLKNRVSQYFQNTAKNIKTSRMVSCVRNFDYILCETEMEALTLENTLIKQYSPRYNIKLKDAKSYPYIKVTNEAYPRFVFTRKRTNDKAKYFGPYSGTATVFSVLRILQKTLGLPSCSRKFPADIGKERPCLYYQMKQCCGVCTGKVSTEEYSEIVSCATEILRGNTSKAKKSLEEQMTKYAEAEQFEAAARCRDTIFAMDRLSQKQNVVASPDTEQDVIALYSDDFCSCISVFYIREGAVRDKTDYVFGPDSIIDASNISTFLCEHYRQMEYIPKNIIISEKMDDGEQASCEEYLSGLASRKIVIKTPERGALKALCDTVLSNAAEKAKQYEAEQEKSDGIIAELAKLLCLEVLPFRIEAYDISNIGSEHKTAGMIVCADGHFKRSDYRSFNIKTVSGIDDYASMREALSRRIDKIGDAETVGSFSEIPDLILLDGGKCHVSAVKEVLKNKGFEIPVFGMVKDDFHKTRALCDENCEISIARNRQIFTFIYKIQEEVHRFTVSKMDSAKRKTLKTSVLEKISGIGPSKAKLLLAHFGGISEIRKASENEIAAVKGISAKDAKAVFEYYNSEKVGK